MRLVERMVQAPNTCLYCGNGNIPGPDREIGPFLDLERDVNWGDSTYLCMNCIAKMAAICDYVDMGQYEEIQQILKQKDEQIHELEAELDSRNRRLKAIAVGRKGIRSVKNELA